MIQQLPLVPSVPHYRFGTMLDGVPFMCDVRWNGRAKVWYLAILDAQAVPIRAGIPIVLGAILGGRCVDKRIPRGLLMAADLSGANRDAGYDDLGTRVVVYFHALDEFTAVAA